MNASSGHLKPILILAYFTGCRLQELLNLKWSQLDLKEKEFRLNPGETKNKAGRIIPLNDLIVNMLANLPRINEFVFTYKHRRLKSINRSFKKASIKAGLDGYHFHDLRRCGARNLIRAGVPEDVVMKIGGWKSRSMLTRYNIVSTEDLKEAMQKRTLKITAIEKLTTKDLPGPLSSLGVD